MPDTIAGPLVDTLLWCRDFMRNNDREPTLRELQDHHDIGPELVRRRLALLRDRGLLRAAIGGKGGRTLTKAGEAMAEAVSDGKVTVTRTGPKAAEEPTRAARRYIGKLNIGWSLGKIAQHYGVSRTAVADVRDRWFHLLKIREERDDRRRAVARESPRYRDLDGPTYAQLVNRRLTRKAV